ncbi:HMG box-containing protein 4 [Drosophila tropicalis]|uniref:HMG box-containing protein 4 n=1 Tax=Drosophila tropicalis TaxID=46794 RepID=UPI0035ABA9F3
MDTPDPVTKDFQVAGVSRSGRVRKKSSKLLDFESPEEIERKTKRIHAHTRQPARYLGRGRPPNALKEREQQQHLTLELDADLSMAYDEQELSITSETENIHTTHKHSGSAQTPALLMNSDEELDTLVQDLVEGVEAEATNNNARVRQSLYMREKSNKRKVIKDGKIVVSKMQRKDKGKSRYTAYSLWAREVRKRDFQDMDFAQAARRLSELWANVSNKDKSAWRRKAKIQATKARTRERNGPNAMASNGTTTTSAPPVITPMTNDSNNFVNRATTSRTKKLAADRRPQPSVISSTSSAVAIQPAAATTPDDATVSSSGPTTPINTRQRRSGRAATLAPRRTVAMNSPTTLNTSDGGADTKAASSSSSSHQLNQTPPPTSIEAIDAAAHLKLLGESLTVIGERLKEHNGHVALSGSLSVLLDSLLCSMGPLLCMTTQIPGLENKAQLYTNLATTLDNIAYVMPGL